MPDVFFGEKVMVAECQWGDAMAVWFEIEHHLFGRCYAREQEHVFLWGHAFKRSLSPPENWRQRFVVDRCEK